MDSCSSSLETLQSELTEVETILEAMLLDTVDGLEPLYPPSLLKTVGGISIRLDKLAAKVDAVTPRPDDEGRRARRKKLSRSVVSEFERCDTLTARMKKAAAAQILDDINHK